MSERERLFRDEAGAALERLAHLEDENRQLRDHVARLEQHQNGPEPGGMLLRPRVPPNLVLALLGGLLAFLGALFTIAPHRGSCHAHRPPPSRVAHTPGIATAPMMIELATPVADRADSADSEIRVVPRRTTTATSDECAKPYFFDEDGKKHYKLHCLR